ncbi:CdaR family transcriptional regulator [Texcoconibacillus texcoconensis]|uniref:Carbohydrate diacid regulator n=1 Tax=Texcoconibacillus texcoconensis TaxID=1095777 RepID=A0A840QSX2_9BACI|nr:sugar diacid recognition domain-containing protein [Texcoconibacillus texcoconensis]MBB5174408.1 carbohydrate diacid regulator [Texcoconibacillus texcoconensis]
MLTATIAQDIVERTMRILPYNINVMDNRGEIIGSGNTERLHTKHEVSLEVIERKETVEIGEEGERSWRGVRQGINLPIDFQGEVVGVVGITGPLEEVCGYGQLVKMTAEMVLEQTFLQEQLQYDRRIQREFVNQWIEGEELRGRMFKEKARLLDVSLVSSRGVMVLHLVGECITDKRRKIQDIENALAYLLSDQDVMTTTYDGYIVIVKEADSMDQLVNVAKQWVNALPMKGVIVGLGDVSAHVEGVSLSFQQARATLNMVTKLNKQGVVFRYDDFQLESLLSDMWQHIDERERLFPFMNELFRVNGQRDLLDTLEAYIACDGRVQETAERLYIHRNTLHYRLEKIKEVTGKDPRQLTDLFALYFAILVEKLKEK